MGLNEGINTFIDDEGKLRGPTYVPAYVRRYPFMLAKLRPDREELSLCFDPKSDVVGAQDEGDRLFEDGKPPQVTQNVLGCFEPFEQTAQRTALFIEALNSFEPQMVSKVFLHVPGHKT